MVLSDLVRGYSEGLAKGRNGDELMSTLVHEGFEAFQHQSALAHLFVALLTAKEHVLTSHDLSLLRATSIAFVMT